MKSILSFLTLLLITGVYSKSTYHTIIHNDSYIIENINNSYTITKNHINLLNKIVNEIKINQDKEINSINKNLVNYKIELSDILTKYNNMNLNLNNIKINLLNLNNTLSKSYIVMMNDIHYLHSLKTIKPKFLDFINQINKNVDNTHNLVNNHIKGEDKDTMNDLLEELRLNYRNVTTDLANEFLDHYNKYAHLLIRDTNKYTSIKKKFNKIIKQYNETKYLRDNVLFEYYELNKIVKRLKRNYKLSIKEKQLLSILMERVNNILLNNKCHIRKFTNSKCSIELLQSHYDNDLI